MCDKLAPAKLIQRLFRLPPNPRIMVDIVLHQMLDVFVDSAVIFGSDTFQLDLKFTAEPNFYCHAT